MGEEIYYTLIGLAAGVVAYYISKWGNFILDIIINTYRHYRDRNKPKY